MRKYSSIQAVRFFRDFVTFKDMKNDYIISRSKDETKADNSKKNHNQCER